MWVNWNVLAHKCNLNKNIIIKIKKLFVNYKHLTKIKSSLALIFIFIRKD